MRRWPEKGFIHKRVLLFQLQRDCRTEERRIIATGGTGRHKPTQKWRPLEVFSAARSQPFRKLSTMTSRLSRDLAVERTTRAKRRTIVFAMAMRRDEDNDDRCKDNDDRCKDNDDRRQTIFSTLYHRGGDESATNRRRNGTNGTRKVWKNA